MAEPLATNEDRLVEMAVGPRAGYGPGFTVLMTAPADHLGSYSAPGTNIASLLNLEF